MQRNSKAKLAVALASLITAFTGLDVTQAANYVWQPSSGASGSWNTATNWNPNLPAGGTTVADDADLSELNLTSDSTVTLDAEQSISVITFGDTDPSTPANWFINATSSAANDNVNFLNLNTANNPTFNVVTPDQTATINATISNGSTAATTWGMAKGGPGTLALTADNAGLTGTIYINNGTLSLDFNHAWSPANNIIGDSSTGSSADAHLELQGGTLSLTGAAGGSNSQTFTGGTNAAIGAPSIALNQNGAASLSLNLGALTRTMLSEAGGNMKEPGAAIDVALPTSGTVSATSPTGAGGVILDANGSAFMTVNSGADWAALNASNNIVPGSSVSGFYTPSSSASLSGNVDMTSDATLTANTTVNTIRQNDSSAHTLDLGADPNTNPTGYTLSTGGILVTPTAGGPLTIQNGILTAPNALAADILIDQNDVNHPTTISASIQNNGSNYTAITKNGAGELILNGNNTSSGDIIVNQGTLSVTAGTLGVVGAPYICTQIAPAFGNSATMNISGNAAISDDHFDIAGNENNFAGGTGVVNQTGGSITNGAWFSVGAFGNGTYNFSGGTNTIIGGFAVFEVGVFGNSVGTANISGTAALSLWNGASVTMGDVGSTGNNTINQNGGTVTTYSDGGTTVGGGGVYIGGSGAGNNNYNLNGGILTTSYIARTSTAGTGNFNFNGGTLRAAVDSQAFINNLTAANVGAGGAIIDTNGHTVTIPQPLIHAASLGATVDGGLTKNGAGTLQLAGISTYTGKTVINAGTLQLPSSKAVVPAPIAAYSFDNINDNANGNGTGNPVTSGVLSAGDVVVNSGTGGTALNGTVNNADYLGLDASGISIDSGKFGNGVLFDGNGSSIDVNSQITDMSGSAFWTMSAWVKTTEQGAAFVSKNDGADTFDTGNSTFYLAGANPPNGVGSYPTAVRNAGGFLQGNTPVADGDWHLVTFVDNGGVRSIYVDGNLSTLNASGFTTTDVSNTVRIGFNADIYYAGDGNVNYFGDLDELQFYGSALTQQQVQELYANNLVTTGTSVGGQLLPASTAVSITASGAALDLNGNDQTIGSLTGVAGSEVLLGSGSLTTGGDNSSTNFAGAISGSGSLIKVGTGKFTLSGANTFTGPTSVNSGTLSLASSLTSTSKISVGSGAILQLQPAASINTANLALGPGGTLDLTTNTAVFDTKVAGHDANTLIADLASAYDKGAWDLPGITSSYAAASHGITTLGYDVSGNSLTIAYTLPGDTNLDGTVNAADLTAMEHGTGWNDFNYDGRVDGDDWALFMLGASLGTPPSVSVPEPAAAMVLAGIGLLGLGARRRRKI